MTIDFEKYTNAFIIGAAKSGTTTLCLILGNHHQVCFPGNKEPSFFAFNEKYQKGIEYYYSLLKPTDETTLIIDGSTPYSRCTIFPEVAQRIYQVAPQAKFVYMMRHPVDRAYAHYKHRWLIEVNPGKLFTETFEEYVEHDKMCIDDSLYKLQIEAYLKYFTKEQFLFCLTEDLNNDLSGLMQRICSHFEIEEMSQSYLEEKKNTKVNDSNKVRDRVVKNKLSSSPLAKTLRLVTTAEVRKWIYDNILSKTDIVKKTEKSFIPPKMKPETRQKLIEYYSETTSWVEETIQRKLPHWYV